MARLDVVLLVGVSLAILSGVQSTPQKVTKRVHLTNTQQETDSTNEHEVHPGITDAMQSIQNTLASLERRILALETNETRLSDRLAVIVEMLTMEKTDQKLLNGEIKQTSDDSSKNNNDGVPTMTTQPMSDTQNEEGDNTAEEGDNTAEDGHNMADEENDGAAGDQGGSLEQVQETLDLLQEAETAIEQAGALLSGNQQAAQSTQAPIEKPNKPSQEPSQPNQEPSQPSQEPSQPNRENSQPSEEPSQPSQEPSQPNQEPIQDPNMPSEPTQPANKPSPQPSPRPSPQHSQIINPGNNGGVAIHNGAPANDAAKNEEGNAQGETNPEGVPMTGDETSKIDTEESDETENETEEANESSEKSNKEEQRRNELDQALGQRHFRVRNRFLPSHGRVGSHSGR